MSLRTLFRSVTLFGVDHTQARVILSSLIYMSNFPTINPKNSVPSCFNSYFFSPMWSWFWQILVRTRLKCFRWSSKVSLETRISSKYITTKFSTKSLKMEFTRDQNVAGEKRIPIGVTESRSTGTLLLVRSFQHHLGWYLFVEIQILYLVSRKVALFLVEQTFRWWMEHCHCYVLLFDSDLCSLALLEALLFLFRRTMAHRTAICWVFHLFSVEDVLFCFQKHCMRNLNYSSMRWSCSNLYFNSVV